MDPAAAAPKRQTKPADERRSEIMDAALELFFERGFHATTVQDIARAAGVAAGTVYLYFPSKEHVLLGLHSHFHAQMQHKIEAAAVAALATEWDRSAPYGVSINAVVDAVVQFCQQHERATTVICRYLPRIHDEAIREGRELALFIGAAIKAAVDDGRAEVADPEMAGHLFTAALREPLIDAIVSGRQDEIPRLAEQAKELFRKAMAPRGEI